MAPTPQGLREAIVALASKGKSPPTICRELGLSRKVVEHWLRRHRETGGVARKPGSGRPPLLSRRAAQQALQLLTAGPGAPAKVVAQQLLTGGLCSRLVDKYTVIRAARQEAARQGQQLQVKRGRPVQQLSPKTREARLAFARQHAKRRWGDVLFTDRKKFMLRYPGACVRMVRWRLKGSPDEAPQASKPHYINIYAGISRHGVTRVRVVAGSSKHKSPYFNQKGEPARNITAGEYRDVLTDTLLPDGDALFGGVGIRHWTLMQDNDPSHSKAGLVLEEWCQTTGGKVKLLAKWPPSSPDLNPIENLWAWMQAEVDKLGVQSYAELEQAVRDVLAAAPPAMLRNLVDSMPGRLREVIKREGRRIGK
jgi:hypothetical protein